MHYDHWRERRASSPSRCRTDAQPGTQNRSGGGGGGGGGGGYGGGNSGARARERPNKKEWREKEGKKKAAHTTPTDSSRLAGRRRRGISGWTGPGRSHDSLAQASVRASVSFSDPRFGVAFQAAIQHGGPAVSCVSRGKRLGQLPVAPPAVAAHERRLTRATTGRRSGARTHRAPHPRDRGTHGPTTRPHTPARVPT
jgi:hypothetical protein